MKKKVLIISYWFPSDEAPLYCVFVEEQAVALSSEYDVAVLIPGLAAWRDVLRPSAPDRSRCEVRKDLRVYREFALPSIPHGPESVIYDAFARSVENGYRKILREWGRPDIVHAHVVLPGGLAAVRLGQKHGLPVVLTEHSSPFSMHLETPYMQRVVRETLSSVDRVVAVSPSLVEQMHACCPDVKIEVIGNLIRTDFFTPLEESHQNNVHEKGKMSFLGVGHLTEQKGFRYLIEAAAILVGQGFTGFEVVIGGDGLERASLEQSARTLGVEGFCNFTGALERERVRDRMQRCDVFVLPSLHETFGVVLGEAMACGKPVIATRSGGPEFVVSSEAGIIVEKGSAEQLAAAMLGFIEGRVKFDPAAVRAYLLQKFGQGAFLRHISSLYEGIWGEAPTRPSRPREAQGVWS